MSRQQKVGKLHQVAEESPKKYNFRPKPSERQPDGPYSRTYSHALMSNRQTEEQKQKEAEKRSAEFRRRLSLNQSQVVAGHPDLTTQFGLTTAFGLLLEDTEGGADATEQEFATVTSKRKQLILPSRLDNMATANPDPAWEHWLETKASMAEAVEAVIAAIKGASTSKKALKGKVRLEKMLEELPVELKEVEEILAESSKVEFANQVAAMVKAVKLEVVRAGSIVRKLATAEWAATASDESASEEPVNDTVRTDGPAQAEEMPTSKGQDAASLAAKHEVKTGELKEMEKLWRHAKTGTLIKDNYKHKMLELRQTIKECHDKIISLPPDQKITIDVTTLILRERECDGCMKALEETRPSLMKTEQPAPSMATSSEQYPKFEFFDSVGNLFSADVALTGMQRNSVQFKQKRQFEESLLSQNTMIDIVKRKTYEQPNWDDLHAGIRLEQFYDPLAAADVQREQPLRINFDGSNPSQYRQFKYAVWARIATKKNMDWFEKTHRLVSWVSGKLATALARCDPTREGFSDAIMTLDKIFGDTPVEPDEMIQDLLTQLRDYPDMSLKDINTIWDTNAHVEEILDWYGRAGKDPVEATHGILACLRMDGYTKRDYERYRQEMKQSQDSLRLFLTWTQVRCTAHIRSKKAALITKGIRGGPKDSVVQYERQNQRKQDSYRRQTQSTSHYRPREHKEGRRNYSRAASENALFAERMEDYDETEAVFFGDSDEEEFLEEDDWGLDNLGWEDDVVALARGAGKCFVCDKPGHKGVECKEWEKYDFKSIRDKIIAAKLCPRCLKSKHAAADCRSSDTCKECGSLRHHTKLHVKNNMTRTEKPKEDLEQQMALMLKQMSELQAKISAKDNATLVGRDCSCPSDNLADGEEVETIALVTKPVRSWMTVPIEIASDEKFTNAILTNALLDQGSSVTLIQPELAKKIGLKGKRKQFAVQVVGDDRVVRQPSVQGKIYVRAAGKQESHEIKCRTFNLPASITPVDPNELKSTFDQIAHIEFPRPCEGGVGVLIGFDNTNMMRSHEDVMVTGGPLARKSPLGWTVLHNGDGLGDFTGLINNWKELNVVGAMSDDTLQYMWDRQFGLESVGIDRAEKAIKRYNLAEEDALRKMKESIRRRQDGLWEVAIPWISEEPNLPKNYHQCLAMQRTLDMKHKKDAGVAEAVATTMAEYLKLGIIEPVPEWDWFNSYFLPYFCVAKHESETTKYRFVYNAKQKFSGTSINEQQHTGPNFLADIFDTMVEFRVGEVAVVADIEKMYLMIALPEKDRKYVRIFVDGKPYQFTRWPFGLRAAPSVANFVVKHHINLYGSDKLKGAARVYMDDAIMSFQSGEEAREVTNELKSLLADCGMNLRKFVSNSEVALRDIPNELRAKAMVIKESEDQVHSTLGLKWDPMSDTIGYKLQPVQMVSVTKRSMASEIAKVFDPLGALFPWLVKARRCLQKIHVAAREVPINWDTELSTMTHPVVKEAVKEYRGWLKEVADAKQIKYPRKMIQQINEKTVLHMCSDGSDIAFATAAYLTNEGSNEVNWVTTKGRMQSLKPRRIPEVELAGCLLSARLAVRLRDLLKIPENRIYYWVDNHPVLCWIKKAGVERDVYVRNRAIEISDTSNVDHWNHIGTHDNPSDIPSRGSSAAQLAATRLYWEGPEFFKWKIEDLPTTKLKVRWEELPGKGDITLLGKDCSYPTLISTTSTGMIKNHVVRWGEKKQVSVAREVNQGIKNLRLKETAFRWSILVRALVRAAYWSMKRHAMPGEVIEPDDVATIVEKLLIHGQWVQFGPDIDQYEKTGNWTRKDIRKLNPAIDAAGLLRARTRLYNQTDLAQSAMFPIIAADSWPFYLYAWAVHRASRHVRNDELWLRLTKQMTGPALKAIARRVSRDCAQCNKLHSPMMDQIMGAVPDLKLKQIRPCSIMAVDFTGFKEIKFCRKVVKAYILVAVCLQTKVVTLEMTLGLSTESLVMAMSRIAARRGPIEEVYSDNGGSFKKMCRLWKEDELRKHQELKHEVEEVDWAQVMVRTSNYVRKWNMNAPRDHEANGQVESFVKLAKKAVNDSIDRGAVDIEVFRTWVAVAEDVVNSRPIAILKASNNTKLAVTPNHLIVGRVGDTDILSNTADSLEYTARELDQEVKKFQSLWTDYYLQELHKRSKWLKESQNVKIGDLVVVAEEDLKIKRNKWSVGQIKEVSRSADGLVRKAKVACKHGVVERGIRQLAPTNSLPYLQL